MRLAGRHNSNFNFNLLSRIDGFDNGIKAGCNSSFMRMEVVDEVAWSICHMFVSVRLSYMVVFLFLYLRTLCTVNAHTFCICALLSTLFAHSLNTICTHHAVQLLLHILCTLFCILLLTLCNLIVHSMQIVWTFFEHSFAHSLHTHYTLLIAHSLCTLCTLLYIIFTHFVHYFYILCIPFQHFCKYFAPYQLRCILKGHLNCIEKKTLHF